MQTLRELLQDRIAPSRQYSERTVELYTQTIDQFERFLGHEPTLDDLDDVTAAKFCKWRLTTSFRGKTITPATVGKDSTQLKAIWNFAAKKRPKRSDGTDIEFPDYRTPTIPKPRPRAFNAEDLAKLVKAAAPSRPYRQTASGVVLVNQADGTVPDRRANRCDSRAAVGRGGH